HYLGTENGIADITAPFASLLGVFLGSDQLDQSAAPPPLDFRTSANRDYLVLAPALKQPFFIGDGLTTSGVVQQVIAPVGASRLFLGVMDQYQWSDNEGAFTVGVAKNASARAVQLSLRPSLNPTTADAVESPGSAAVPSGITSPELHAFTAIEL